MPYKISGTKVLVKKNDKWRVLKKHKTRKEALAHFRALKINVSHKKK